MPVHTSRIYSDSVFLNMRDTDEQLLRLIRQVPETEGQKDETELDLYAEEIKPSDLRFDYPEEIIYDSDINKLAAQFGRRCGTKFETFAAGVETRVNPETVRNLLGKRFLIAFESSEKLYLGSHVSRELFEQISVHLSIVHMDKDHIVCTATDRLTRETISALWEHVGVKSRWEGGSDIKKRFYMTQID